MIEKYDEAVDRELEMGLHAVMCAWHPRLFGGRLIMRPAAAGHERDSVAEGICPKCRDRLRVIEAAPELLAAAETACELMEGYIDVVDGDYGVPEPNKAMRAVQVLKEAIEKAERQS